jgi:hypothetical protein
VIPEGSEDEESMTVENKNEEAEREQQRAEFAYK